MELAELYIYIYELFTISRFLRFDTCKTYILLCFGMNPDNDLGFGKKCRKNPTKIRRGLQ